MPSNKPPKLPKTTAKLDTPSSPARLASGSEASGNLANSSQIITAIESLKEDFVSRFDALLGAIQGIQGELKEISGRMTEAEERISTNEDVITSLQAQSQTMQTTLEEMTRKVDDLENQARRSNLRLVGLPEGKEGTNMCAFLENMIPEVLGEFPNTILIERAHRIGSVQRQSGNVRSPVRPRAIVMKFLSYADKERVMAAARDAGQIKYDEQRIMFFPDISSSLRKRRQVFDPVKKQLAALSYPTLRYGVIHPATLLITIKGRRHTFDTASEAEKFVRGLMADTEQADTEQADTSEVAEPNIE